MNSLRRALEVAVERKHKQHGAVSPRLIRNLQQLRRRYFISFLVLESFLSLGLAIGVYILWRQPLADFMMVTLGGGIGLGAGGSIEMMRRVWRDWGKVDLCLILMEGAEEAEVLELAERLLEKI
jgi:hypothetical protein